MTTTTTFYVNPNVSLGLNMFPLVVGNANLPGGIFLQLRTAGSAYALLIGSAGSLPNNVRISQPVVLNVTGQAELINSGNSGNVALIVNLVLFNPGGTIKQQIASTTVNIPITSSNLRNISTPITLQVPSSMVFTSSDMIGCQVTCVTTNAGAMLYGGAGFNTILTVTTTPTTVTPVQPIYIPPPVRPIDIPSQPKPVDSQERLIIIIIVVVVVLIILILLIVLVMHASSDSRPLRPIAYTSQ